MRHVLTIVITAAAASGATALAMWQRTSDAQERAAVLEQRVAEFSNSGAGAGRSAAAGGTAEITAAEHVDDQPFGSVARKQKSNVSGAGPQTAAAANTAALFAPEAGSDDTRPTPARGFEAALLKNPEYRAAALVEQRTRLMESRPDLAAELGISPAKASALFNLLAEQEMITREQFSRPFTSPEASQAARAAAKQSLEAVDKRIAALLGEQDHAELKQYQSTFAARAHVIDLRSALAASPEPLRQDQVEPLIAAIDAEQRHVAVEFRDFMAGKPPMPDEWRQALDAGTQFRHERTAAAYDRLRGSTSALLTPTQSAALDTVLRNDLSAREARTRMNRLRREAREGAPPQKN